MVKIKYNEAKDTYSLKGMSQEHMDILASLMTKVVLGQKGYAESAFELADAFEKSAADSYLDIICSIDCDGNYELVISE